MDHIDVCPNCGRSFPHNVDHRCSTEEGMINKFDDIEDSTPFLDEVVKESKSFDESASSSVERCDFTESGMEELKENILEQTEDEYESKDISLSRKYPLISEGNPFTPPNEESSTEESKEDAFEAIGALDECIENVSEFLDTDASLYTIESVPIVWQYGNPLDGLPFEPLVTDDSSDLNQRLDKNVKSTFTNQMQSTSINIEMAKSVSDLRLNKQKGRETTTKDDCGNLSLRSLLKSSKLQNRSGGASVAMPGIGESDPSRVDHREHSETASKIVPIKHKAKRTFPCGICDKVLHSKTNREYHMRLHEHQNTPEEPSVVLPGSSQSDPSRVDHREHSKTVSKITPLKHEAKRTFPCGQCGNVLSSKRDHESHMRLHEYQNTSVPLPSATQGCTSRPELSEHSRTEIKKSPLKHSPKKTFLCDQCGKILSSRQAYSNHMALHTDVKSFVCKECGKAFATNSYLKNHTRSHTGDRRYECSVCGKRFFQRNHLNAHFITHTGEQPFVCERCGRAFSHQSNYCRHRRRHTE